MADTPTNFDPNTNKKVKRSVFATMPEPIAQESSGLYPRSAAQQLPRYQVPASGGGRGHAPGQGSAPVGADEIRKKFRSNIPTNVPK